MLKEQKGITLVALVITVIVLLILAGVAMSLITDQGNLFDRTNTAATRYKEAASNEANTLNTLNTTMDTYWNQYANTTN